MAACVNHPDRLLAYEEACPLCMNTIEGMERDGDAQARACPPACGCTQTARCHAAHIFHTLWQQDSDGQRYEDLLDEYRIHLRRAGVTPGQARWETNTLTDENR